jgi:hypothetical protein
MAKDYTVNQFKVGTFTDPNGNTWCDMALQGVGEPVKIVVKDPTKFHDGMELYGKIEEKTSKAGKTYLRFYREQKQDAPAQGSTYDSNGAKHGNALKIAADFYLGRGVHDMNEDQFVGAVESLAKRIFSISIPEQAVASTETKVQATGTTSPELQSLASTYGNDVVAEIPDGEINLDSIPF